MNPESNVGVTASETPIPAAAPQDPMLASAAEQAPKSELPQLPSRPESTPLGQPKPIIASKNKPAKSSSSNPNVTMAIVATVIIVVVLAVLAVYAYQKH